MVPLGEETMVYDTSVTEHMANDTVPSVTKSATVEDTDDTWQQSAATWMKDHPWDAAATGLAGTYWVASDIAILVMKESLLIHRSFSDPQCNWKLGLKWGALAPARVLNTALWVSVNVISFVLGICHSNDGAGVTAREVKNWQYSHVPRRLDGLNTAAELLNP